MILRPVRPQSPTGPPMTNLPVGLMWNLVVDNQLAHRFLQILLRDVRVVLGGEDNGVNAGDFVIFIAERHL